MENLSLDKRGRFKRSLKLHPLLVALIVLAVFVSVYFLSRESLRVWAFNRVMYQTDQWDKDGVLMQGTTFTCVPASVVMLLRDQGIFSSTLDVMGMCDTNTEGTDPASIPAIGENFGFTVTKRTLGFDDLMALNLPVVAMLTYRDMYHAVYVKPDQEKGWLDVKDPSMGRLYIAKNQAEEYFGSDKWECYVFAGQGRR
jgi:hypothetical protein